MLNEMNKPTTPDDVLEQLRKLPPDERAWVEAQLAKDAEAAGKILDGEDDPAFRARIRVEAQRALDHPGENIPGDQFFDWLDKLRDKHRRS
jgi:hypothetical protein